VRCPGPGQRLAARPPQSRERSSKYVSWRWLRAQVALSEFGSHRIGPVSLKYDAPRRPIYAQHDFTDGAAHRTLRDRNTTQRLHIGVLINSECPRLPVEDDDYRPVLGHLLRL